MKKRIVFPCTNRAHLARQKTLVAELRKRFIVDIFEPKTPHRSDLEAYTILAAVEFKNFIARKHYDAGLVRADRMELLPIAGILAYRRIPIIHLEGGAVSGARVIDTRIRDAITSLADIHFVTDERALRRVASLGALKVYDVGSLDVSFAVETLKKKPERLIADDYILLLHHAIPGEETETLIAAVKPLGLKVIGIKSNSDYSRSLMTEEYSPEDFISLMHHAKCFLGNSSALCKEASVLGVPGVLTGHRQDGRDIGWNILRVPHKMKEIRRAVKWQMAHGRFERDNVYFKENTEKRIASILEELL